MAQEAHEAIRPTKLEPRPKTKRKLDTASLKLYSLIFNRAVACQMKEAEINLIKIKINGVKGYLFQSETEQVLFDGFFKLLNPKFVEANKTKPHLLEGEKISLAELAEELLQTKPPPRFNEASLIRTLEEKGIGRPSTYAPILSLIQEKNYVEKDGRYFIPTGLGTAVCDYLSSSFPEIFNLEFISSWRFWLFLYLSFCVVSHIAPSKKDRLAMWHGLFVIIIIVFLINLLLTALGINMNNLVINSSKYLGFLVGIFSYALILSLLHFFIVKITLGRKL